MWWNGSFVPWMWMPQISINCKMLSYNMGQLTFVKNAFSTLLNQCDLELRQSCMYIKRERERERLSTYEQYYILLVY